MGLILLRVLTGGKQKDGKQMGPRTVKKLLKDLGWRGKNDENVGCILA